MSSNRVSILIPLYNSEKWIASTIESALNQTYKDIEIIVVDDGSTDDSLKVAESFTSERVIVHSQENKGACAARNKAIELATGAYINFLDADDQIGPDKITLQMQIFEEFGDDIIVSSSWEGFYESITETEDGRKQIDKDYEDPINWLLDSWNGMGWAIPAVWLIPIEIIKKTGPWDERLKINQDGEFFSRVLLKVDAIKYCDGGRAYYRRGRSSSISAGLQREASSLFLSYQLYKQHVLSIRNDTAIRSALARNFQNIIYLYHMTHPDLVKMAQEEIKSLNVSPSPIYGGTAFILLSKITSFDFAIRCRALLQ